MLRSVLIHVGLVLLPSALYLLWLLVVRPRALDALKRRRLPEGPWIWLAIVGLVLMSASLVYLALSPGGDPGAAYEPPRYEEGEAAPEAVEER